MDVTIPQLLRLARRWWWLLVLAPLVGGTVGNVVATLRDPLYSATATLLLAPPEDTGEPDYSGDVGVGLVNLTETYQHLVTSRPVLAEVVERLALPYGVDLLRSKVSASQVLETRLLRVSAADGDAERAAAIANAVAERFAAHIAGLSEAQATDLIGLASRAQVTVIEPAAPASSPEGTGAVLYVVLGSVGALLLAGSWIALREHLDLTVKAGHQALVGTGVPLVASVRWVPRLLRRRGEVFVRTAPGTAAAAAIRLLRTNVRYAAASGGLRTLAISSPSGGEGRSTIAANLAVALAQAGEATVLVDADLQAPRQHRIFHVANDEGLTTLLADPEAAWQAVAVAPTVPGLRLIPSGPLSSIPVPSHRPDRLRAVLREIAAAADVVVLDAPPVLGGTDPLMALTCVDGVLLVCRAGKTRFEALRRALEAMQLGAVRVIGMAINQQTLPEADDGPRLGLPWSAGDLVRRAPPLEAAPPAAAPRGRGATPPGAAADEGAVLRAGAANGRPPDRRPTASGGDHSPR